MKSAAKIEREKYGPSMAEVVLGATLSLALGAVLGAVYLFCKPVQTVREIPKPEERTRGQIYYVEGSRDANKARNWMRKRQLLVEGQSAEIPLVEDELNAWVAGTTQAPESSGALIAPGSVNFRIREGELQIGVTTNVNAVGYVRQVVFQARGTVVRQGDVFRFDPTEFYAGSLNLGRIPFMEGFFLSRLQAAHAQAPELVEGWRKLSAVTVTGDTLQLTLP